MSEAYRVGLLIQGGLVVTMDQQHRVIPDGSIAVNGNQIVAVGAKDEVALDAGERVDARGCLVMPGLINTHTHAGMTVFRGMADDLPLEQWLRQHIWPAEVRFMTGDAVFLGTQLAVAEMIRSGTTTFCDMYFCEDRVAQAAQEAGMRVVLGEGVLDFPTPNVQGPTQGLRVTEELARRWQGDALVQVCVAPHAIYTCSREVLKAARETANRFGLLLHIHLSETRSEVEQSLQKYGMTPTQYLEHLGVLEGPTLAVHCVQLTSQDIDILARHRVAVAHCPESNMKLASGIAPIPSLLEAGVCVGLATDGAASNNDLDMIGELQTAARLHKVSQGDPTILPAPTVLEMATTRAARALGMQDRIGSLEVGKSADLVIVRLDHPHLVPCYNPYSLIAYSLGRGDVDSVMINGRWVMRDQKVLTINEADLMLEIGRFSQRVQAWMATPKA